MAEQLPQWLETTLQAFSPGEFQYGTEITELSRDPFKKHHPIQKTGRRIKGTGIPAYVFSKFRSGEWTPREKSRKKIAAFLKRYRYNQLRTVGAKQKEAKKASRIKEYLDFNAIYNDYFKFAQEVGKIKNVKPEFIMYTMRKSELKQNDFDAYIEQLKSETRTKTLYQKLTKTRPVRHKGKPAKKLNKKQLFNRYKNDIKNDMKNMSKNKRAEYREKLFSKIDEKLKSEKLSSYEKQLFRDVKREIKSD